MLALLTVACISMPLDADAKKKKRKGKGKAKKSKTVDKNQDIVKSVDTKTGMIKVNGKTYIFSDNCKVFVNGEKAQYQDIKVGMKVSMSVSILTHAKGDTPTIYKITRIQARTK